MFRKQHVILLVQLADFGKQTVNKTNISVEEKTRFGREYHKPTPYNMELQKRFGKLVHI